jgi:hypothetical protein
VKASMNRRTPKGLAGDLQRDKSTLLYICPLSLNTKIAKVLGSLQENSFQIVASAGAVRGCIAKFSRESNRFSDCGRGFLFFGDFFVIADNFALHGFSPKGSGIQLPPKIP